MSGQWKGSTRGKTTSTTEWKRLRLQVLDRDRGVCYLCGQAGATEVDHRLNVAAGGTDELSNLGAVHTDCHRKKTSAEANAARPRQKRPAEQHPGLL